MDFIETVVYIGKSYCVKGNRVVIDQSFAHAFGIERGYSYEVDDLEIFEAFDECGEDTPFDNTDKDLIYNLTQILEEKFNECID